MAYENYKSSSSITITKQAPEKVHISLKLELHPTCRLCTESECNSAGWRGRVNSWLQRDIASAAHAQNAASPTTAPLHHNNIDQLTLWLAWRHVNKAAFSCAKSPCLQGFSLPLGLLRCQRSIYIVVSTDIFLSWTRSLSLSMKYST